MGKSKEPSQDLHNLVVAKPTDDIGYRKISKLQNVPVSTVGLIIRKWKEHHFTIMHYAGAPREVSDRGVRGFMSCPRSTDHLWRALERPGVTIVSTKTISNAFNRHDYL